MMYDFQKESKRRRRKVEKQKKVAYKLGTKIKLPDIKDSTFFSKTIQIISKTGRLTFTNILINIFNVYLLTLIKVRQNTYMFASDGEESEKCHTDTNNVPDLIILCVNLK